MVTARGAEGLQLPTAFGEPPASGRLRVVAEDFRVEEILGFEPDGAGGHALLVVEKRGVRQRASRDGASQPLAEVQVVAADDLLTGSRRLEVLPDRLAGRRATVHGRGDGVVVEEGRVLEHVGMHDPAPAHGFGVRRAREVGGVVRG